RYRGQRRKISGYLHFRQAVSACPQTRQGKQTSIVSACVKRLASRHRNQQNQRATDCNFSDVNSAILLQLDAF
ncbi:hypothetical protein ACWIVX_00795, partial [Enterobacter asburiae]